MFRKLNLILTVLIIVICFNLTPIFADNMFPDVKADDWYYEDLQTLAKKDIVQGSAEGYFKPTDTVRYNQYLKMVVVALTDKTLDAKDGEEWDAPYIEKAFELNLISNKTKDYNIPINRYEMAEIALKGLTVLKEEATDYIKYKTDIKDYDTIPEKYKEIVLKAYSKGLITGYTDGTYGGEKTMRRSESVAVIARLIDKTLRKTPGEGKIPEEKPERPKGETSVERLRSEKVYEVYEKVPEMILHYTKNYDTLYYREDGQTEPIGVDLDVYVGEISTMITIYKNSPKTLEVAKKIIKIYYPGKYEEVYQAVVNAYEKNIKYDKIINGKTLDIRRVTYDPNIVVIRMYNIIY